MPLPPDWFTNVYLGKTKVTWIFLLFVYHGFADVYLGFITVNVAKTKIAFVSQSFADVYLSFGCCLPQFYQCLPWHNQSDLNFFCFVHRRCAAVYLGFANFYLVLQIFSSDLIKFTSAKTKLTDVNIDRCFTSVNQSKKVTLVSPMFT